MILPKQDLLELIGESDSFDLDFTHKAVEKEIKNYCGWDMESATYTNRLVDGSGNSVLNLCLKNITALSRISTSIEPAIKIKHTTASSNAYAKVVYSSGTPTSLDLTVDDGSDASSSSIAFSTYTTMSTVIAQIASNGWSAEVYDTDYNSFASTNLLELENLYAGTWDGTDPGWEYLYMAGEPMTDFTLRAAEGTVIRSGGWAEGTRNIPITLTAGWTTPNMPEDLKQSVAMLVRYFYTKHQEQTIGIRSFSLGHLSIQYNTEISETGSSSIPIEVLDVLDLSYKVGSLV